MSGPPLDEQIAEVKGQIKEVDRTRGQLTQRKKRLVAELQSLFEKQKEMVGGDDDADV